MCRDFQGEELSLQLLSSTTPYGSTTESDHMSSPSHQISSDEDIERRNVPEADNEEDRGNIGVQDQHAQHDGRSIYACI